MESSSTGVLRRAPRRVSKPISLLVLATALVASGASAQIGVTSAVQGEPRGMPPTEPVRVLRIGVDIQANELVTTGPADRAHLVFLDGSSLTVGPDARLLIDRYVYDPSTKIGDLAINASKGVMRLVGGRISKKTEISITTPSGQIGIRGGIAIFDVQPARTTATFLFGRDMNVRAHGVVRIATRAGSRITIDAGSPPGSPILVGPGELAAELQQLEGDRAGLLIAIPPSMDGPDTHAQVTKPDTFFGNLGGAGPMWQLWGAGVPYANPSAINRPTFQSLPHQPPPDTSTSIRVGGGGG